MLQARHRAGRTYNFADQILIEAEFDRENLWRVLRGVDGDLDVVAVTVVVVGLPPSVARWSGAFADAVGVDGSVVEQNALLVLPGSCAQLLIQVGGLVGEGIDPL